MKIRTAHASHAPATPPIAPRRPIAMLAFLPLLVALATLTPSASGQFYSVGRPPGGSVSSRVNGLSSDGTVAGGSVRASGIRGGYRWTLADGRYDFGYEPGMPANTFGENISGDGRFVVGVYVGTDGRSQAYRWSSETSLQNLGTVGGFWPNSSATAANRDGGVIVGKVRDNSGNFFEPFRWTEAGGMQMLRQNNGSVIYGEANAVSDDGNTVIGHSVGSSRGFVWTTTNGYRLLDGLPGVEVYSTALGMSRNGNFIVGNAGIISTGAMWSSNGVIDLGKLPGYRSFEASEINDAGTIVAGTSSGFQLQATIWTQGRGIETLVDYLVTQGVTLPLNVVLSECTSMSADGLTFAGQASIAGQSNSGFGYVVTVPAPTSLVLIAMFGGFMSIRRRP